MHLIAPLPEPVRKLLPHNTHPGLMLDKYVESWSAEAGAGKLSERIQRPAVDAVVCLSQKVPSGLDFAAVRRRWEKVLDNLSSARFRAVTAGPLTLHLARPGALENAGICLHPLYGFVYLPGTGLKGLSHAWACEVWLPGQPDRAAAWKTICEVFGWAPSPGLRDLAKRHEVEPPENSQAGAVVFHDAWPEKWPPLQTDILNSHHSNYYQGKEPPGDWDNPVPVYFLSVSPGRAFTFAVSPRRPGDGAALVEHAVRWLAGGLEQLGAGAKTATGYGNFKVEMAAEQRQAVQSGWDGARNTARRAELACTLELATPAFLAGAGQQAEDCELRPATLRGLLRWWWRTLHAGLVDVADLRRMEAAIWGDTASGGAVRLTVEPEGDIVPRKYDKNALQQRNQLPTQPARTTQGLWYHSFGMDAARTVDGRSQRCQRWVVLPGARWKLRLTARRTAFTDGRGRTVRLDDVAAVLDQARVALWLLCRHGGVGSKSRKGFGSFRDSPQPHDLDHQECRHLAAAFRNACGVGGTDFDSNLAESPALEQVLPFEDLPLGWTNHWYALDQVGAAAQSFAKRYKHQLEKKALGLPRNIPQPQGQFRPGRHVKDRHASPVWYHLARGADGAFVLRVTAFPARELPNLDASRNLLMKLLECIRTELQGRVAENRPEGRRPPFDPPAAPAASGPVTARMPNAGERVQAELLPEKTAKGGWRARHIDSGRAGPIVNSADVPAERQPGDRVELIVASVNPRDMSFRYPTAADVPPKKDGKGKPPPTGRGPGGRGGPRRGR